MSFTLPISARLRLDPLEQRDVPSTLQILFDYRYDNGFFNDATRRAALEQAGADIAARLNASVDLAPIVPSGGNNWTATTFHPGDTSQQIRVPNLSVGSDQVVVFVGGGAGGGGEAGLGGPGGYSAGGNATWFNTLRTRGRGGFSTWGGSVAFDPRINWNFGTFPAGNQTDFYTVATHELGHVLGLGASAQWEALVSGNQFTGANARAANGGVNPRVDGGHWAANGASMQPFVQAGTRVGFSALDFAALADLGWEVGAVASSPVPTVPAVSTPIPTSPQLPATSPVVVGGSNGTFQTYTLTAGGLVPTGGPVTPFAWYSGPIRVTTGDFDGDGVQDIAAAAGPGSLPAVKVFSGRTGQEVNTFLAYEREFGGGVFLAAGDINGDGRDDLVTGADRSGGPRVRVMSGGDVNAVLMDFYGIEDASFRGGVRVAVGDVNADGRDDLVCAAGDGGGPRVAVYDGRAIANWQTTRLVWDFYAFDQFTPNGAYVAVGDYDGDGFDDVVSGPGSGDTHLKVLSGRLLSTTNAPTALAAPLVDTVLPGGGGGRVAAGDYNGDGHTEVLIGTGPNAPGRFYVASPFGLLATDPFGGRTEVDGLSLGMLAADPFGEQVEVGGVSAGCTCAACCRS